MAISHRPEDEAESMGTELMIEKISKRSLGVGVTGVGMVVHLLKSSFGVIACSLSSFSELPRDQRDRITDTLHRLWLKQPYSPHHIHGQPGYHIFLKQRYVLK